jgi:hypothetical protein
MFNKRTDKWTWLGVIRQHGENANLVSYPTQVIYRLLMKRDGEMIGIEEKKMGTQGNLKRSWRKRQIR